MKIFDAESPLMSGLSRITDLILLNLVVLVCCLPVITIGAAMTGMHYVLLKMVRDEEGYVVRAYFKSFRENFRQATILWGIYLLFGLVVYMDLALTGPSAAGGLQLPAPLRYLIMGGGIFVTLVYLYVFPLLSRFSNTVGETLANAARLVPAAFPRTFAMALVTLAFPAAVRIMPVLFPVEILLGLTGPGFLCALIYDPVFRRIEDRIRGTSAEDDL